LTGSDYSYHNRRMITEDDLLKSIDAHLLATGKTETAFGVEVANDPSLVSDLRKGRSPRLRLAIRIMDAIQPKDAA